MCHRWIALHVRERVSTGMNQGGESHGFNDRVHGILYQY